MQKNMAYLLVMIVSFMARQPVQASSCSCACTSPRGNGIEAITNQTLMQAPYIVTAEGETYPCACTCHQPLKSSYPTSSQHACPVHGNSSVRIKVHGEEGDSWEHLKHALSSGVFVTGLGLYRAGRSFKHGTIVQSWRIVTLMDEGSVPLYPSTCIHCRSPGYFAEAECTPLPMESCSCFSQTPRIKVTISYLLLAQMKAWHETKTWFRWLLADAATKQLAQASLEENLAGLTLLAFDKKSIDPAIELKRYIERDNRSHASSKDKYKESSLVDRINTKVFHAVMYILLPLYVILQIDPSALFF